MVWDQRISTPCYEPTSLWLLWGNRKSPQFARFEKGDFLKKAGFLNQTGAQTRPESMKRIKKVVLVGRQNF